MRAHLCWLTIYDAQAVLAYFDGGQHAKATAARLGIHVNTMRQRLASAEALVGPWNDNRRGLELHVALRLWHIGVDGGQPPGGH